MSAVTNMQLSGVFNGTVPQLGDVTTVSIYTISSPNGGTPQSYLYYSGSMAVYYTPNVELFMMNESQSWDIDFTSPPQPVEVAGGVGVPGGLTTGTMVITFGDPVTGTLMLI